ncbi:MAG: alanine dehydrogenase [Pseudomonadota bacterium]
MRVGVPKEIKNHEYRVGLTPESVSEFTTHGHEVTVETGAGLGIGATDDAYAAAGATIAPDAEAVFEEAKLIVKVKEPQAVERARLRQDHVLYAYLHLAPDPEQTSDLIKSKATCIAYETVTDDMGGLPLLKPMSQVAGRLAIQAGAKALEKAQGGRGVLLGGVPGVRPARVVIIGGGVVGFNAAQMATGLHADVTIMDRDVNVLERLEAHFDGRATVLFSTKAALAEELATADLVVGAVLIPGATAPKLISREGLSKMQPGAVLADVAIDQGGCFETSKPTTHDDPTYIVDDIVHYCVANMPGAVARTSTYALNNVTLPHALAIADKGWQQALKDNGHLANGLNVWNGHITNDAVAESLGKPILSVSDALAQASA